MSDPLDFDFDDSPTVASGIDGKQYLVDRGILPEVVDSYAVTGRWSFRGRAQQAVGFPYRASDPVATKWRSTDKEHKQFSQHNVCEDFYLLETYETGNDIIICEGEIDALAWKSVDLPDNITVFSVPSGAPKTVRDGAIDPREDKKFRFVFRAKTAIESASRIYLSTDNDVPGKALAEELTRRIGRSKIWEIELPEKDAADTLRLRGPNVLERAFDTASPLPLIGLHTTDDFADEFAELYESGGMYGASTGLGAVDKLISVPPGMMTIATGFPGSGKSDFIDQICVNLARDKGWKTVYCSFEKPPIYHMAQLAQKLTGHAFFEDSPGCRRMLPEERDHATTWIREHFMFMDSSRGGPSDMDGILDAASAAVMRMGCRVLVIDPYNYISVDRSGLETDAISDMLTKVRAWARQHDAHVFFVAHPSKPEVRGGKYICGGNDVSKSAAWFAKADIGMTNWRSPDNESELHVWKVRWGWMGRTGYCSLTHTPENSRWLDHQFDDSYDWGDPDDWNF